MHTLVYGPETARMRADIHLLAAAKAGGGKIGHISSPLSAELSWRRALFAALNRKTW